jgi:hypothetical protein
MMSLRISRTEQHILNMRTRMPFRYGIAELRALPHLFLTVTVVVDGIESVGVASEGLAPKWFTKNPQSHPADDIAEMLAVIDNACRIAEAIEEADSWFDVWQQVHSMQHRWGDGQGYASLLWGMGVALVERAALDAYCNAKRTTFVEALHSGELGVRLGDIFPELADTQPTDWLPRSPQRRIIARHTVGLSDPLTADDIAPGERVSDGLPQALDECIAAYGLTHFKLKVGGNAEADLERLRRIARVIETHAVGPMAFTIDGNEGFSDAAVFRTFWERVRQHPALQQMMAGLLFVEQPLHRDVALSDATAEVFNAWKDRPPLIIDESGGDLHSLHRAIACGYVGTSHKNCKGVVKGIANASRIAQLNREAGRERYILSGEDLSNVPPTALLQDLAVMAALGVGHVERNGHHYFRGASMLPEAMQQALLKSHADLYAHHSAASTPALRICDGKVDVTSVLAAPFGIAFNVDPTGLAPRQDWNYASLGL